MDRDPNVHRLGAIKIIIVWVKLKQNRFLYEKRPSCRRPGFVRNDWSNEGEGGLGGLLDRCLRIAAPDTGTGIAF